MSAGALPANAPALPHEAPLAHDASGPLAIPDRYAWQRPAPRTASTTRRAFAFAADAVVVFLLAWMATAAAAAAGLLHVPDVRLLGQANDAFALLWIVGVFEIPLLLAYFTLLETLTGRTPGKLLLGLRVVKHDGTPLTGGDAFLRNLLRLLWITPVGPAFLLLDAWALQTTELDQRMGDLAAGTLVVEDATDADA